MDAIGSTDILHFMATHDLRILLERAAPRGSQKRDVATLQWQNGKNVTLRRGSFSTGAIGVPIDTLNDFMGASYVRETSATEGESVFELTEDGKAAGAKPTGRDVGEVV